jgi:hypothetical protein
VLGVRTSHAVEDLAGADHLALGVQDISVRVDADGLLVSWRSLD